MSGEVSLFNSDLDAQLEAFSEEIGALKTRYEYRERDDRQVLWERLWHRRSFCLVQGAEAAGGASAELDVPLPSASSDGREAVIGRGSLLDAGWEYVMS